jgi:transposase
MKKRQKLLTDEQWELVDPLLRKPKQRRDKRGRPPAPNRACFEGILWILQTGAAWRFLPDDFPSPATCWRRPRQKPERVIADRGYDSDPLRERFQQRGIDLIVPYRANNNERRHEDGRKLRRYLRRWIVERTNAWLGQFRRLLVRHEHLLATYRAFFYLACFWITLRRCF